MASQGPARTGSDVNARRERKAKKVRRVVRPNPDQQVRPTRTLAETSALIKDSQDRQRFRQIQRNVGKPRAAPKGPAATAQRIAEHQSRSRSPQKTAALIRKSQARERARAPKKESGFKRTVRLLYPGVLDEKKTGGKVSLAAVRPRSVPTAATGIPGLAIKNTALSIREDPIKQTKRIPGDLAKAVIAIPAGLYKVAQDPEQGAKDIAKDYSTRYGPLTKGPAGEKAFRERQAKEGITPEFLDATAVGSGAGAGVGQLAQAGARTGKLGEKMQRVATEPRPDIQVSAGKTSPQPLSRNLAGNITRKAVDRRRAKAITVRLARRPDAKNLVDDVADRTGTVRPGLVADGPVGKARRAQLERKARARLNSSSRVTMKGELNRTSRKVEIEIEKKLGKDEKRGLTAAVKFGVRSPAQARRVLAIHAAQIRAERAANPDVSLTDKTDRLSEIEGLIADADKVFTPNVARIADQYGGVIGKVSDEAPGLPEAVSRRARAVKPIAELSGVRIREAETKPELARRKRAAVAQQSRAKRAVVVAERKGAREQGRAEIRQQTADAQTLRAHPAYRAAASQFSKAVKKRDAAKVAWRNEAGTPGVSEAAVAVSLRRVAAAQKNVESAKAAFTAVKGDLDAAAAKATTKAAGTRGSTPEPIARLGRPVRAKALQDAEANIVVRRGELEKATAARKQIKRRPAESDKEFLARHDAAKPKDLAEPAYFKSEKRSESRFGAFTHGSGVKAKPKPNKRYEGELSRTGRESSDPAVLVRSIAGNVTRKYNWRFIRDDIRDGSPEWARNQDRSRLLDQADRRNIDPDSFVLVRHQIIERDAKLADEKVDSGDVTDDGDFAMQTSIHESLKEASMSGAKAVELRAAGKLDLDANSGWTLMSKTRHDEMMSDATPSGAVNRRYTVAKGKVSRIMLGTPGWLQFQTASNAFLTGIAGTGPVDFVKAQAWWKGLPDEQKAALEPLFGITPFFDEQTKLGATATGRITNAWRGLKTTPLYNSKYNVSTLPRRYLDAIFRADNAQNNAFRKAVLYSQVKREAYARMGASAQSIVRAQDTLAPSLEAFAKRAGHLKDLGPKRMMAEGLKDQAQMEKHAEYVRDFLGDYVTYTARERRFIGKSLMFYGFLRYSLRFTFYTMPVKHPVMTAIGTQLGRMQIDELERIFGSEPPPWELANFYNEDGSVRVNIGRMVPFLNATAYYSPESGAPTLFNAALASLPPYMQTALNAGLGRDVAKDKNPTVAGSKYYTRGTDVRIGDRAKIAAAELANVPPVFRLVKKTGIPGIREPDRGKQTSESSLFNPDPRVYKEPKKIAENEQRKLEDAKASPFREFLAPIASPTDGRKVIRASQERAIKNGKPIQVRKVPGAKVKAKPKTETQRAIDEAVREARSPETQRLIREALRAARNGG